MARFKVGDPILLLAKYAHLYPSNCGVVRTVNFNKARQLFDECEVEFTTGAIEMIHAFQAVEDASSWPTLTATIVPKPLPALRNPIRGSTARRMLFDASPFEIDAELGYKDNRRFLLGQITQKDSASCRFTAEVRLLDQGQPIAAARTGELGEFEFSDVPPGLVNIEFLARPFRQRILASLAGDDLRSS